MNRAEAADQLKLSRLDAIFHIFLVNLPVNAILFASFPVILFYPTYFYHEEILDKTILE